MGQKRKHEPNFSGLYIPMGVFVGLGTGIFIGGKFVPVMLFLGLAGGFYMLMVSQRRYHRKIIKEEERLFLQSQAEQKAIKMEKEPQEQGMNTTYLESTFQHYRESLLRIQHLVQQVPQDKKAIVLDILVLLEKVGTYVEKEPSRYSTTKVFFQTYITATETILAKYVMLVDQPVMTEAAVASIKNIDSILLEMKTEFEEAYVKLYEGDVNQLNVEMAMLRNKFKEEKIMKWP